MIDTTQWKAGFGYWHIPRQRVQSFQLILVVRNFEVNKDCYPPSTAARHDWRHPYSIGNTRMQHYGKSIPSYLCTLIHQHLPIRHMFADLLRFRVCNDICTMSVALLIGGMQLQLRLEAADRFSHPHVAWWMRGNIHIDRLLGGSTMPYINLQHKISLCLEPLSKLDTLGKYRIFKRCNIFTTT